MRPLRSVVVLSAVATLALFGAPTQADAEASPAARMAPAEASPAGQPAAGIMSVESTLLLRYLSGGLPTALGHLDLVRYSVPFYELTLGLVAPSGVRASITGSWVAEYHRRDALSVPWGEPGNRLAAENNSITAGVLSLPLAAGSLSLGRQPVSFGPSPLSNLQVSRHVPWLDAVVLRLPMGLWSLEQAVATLENRRGIGDVAGFARDGYDFGISTILLSTRRFSWTGGSLEFGIGAQAILTRPYNAFQLGDVFPVYSIHNADVGRNNLFTAFDVTLELHPDHRQYAIVGFDDINAGLLGIADGSIPTIWAVVAGAEGRLSSGPAGAGRAELRYAAELAATHYLWGSYDDAWALSRSIYRLRADAGSLVLPLTSPYGPGRVSFETRLALDLPPRLCVSLSTLLLAGDPSVDLVTTPYAPRDTTLGFLLLRADASAEYRPVTGLYVAAGVGADVLPAEIRPRFALGLRWVTGQ